jgi:hypothetical protein
MPTTWSPGTATSNTTPGAAAASASVAKTFADGTAAAVARACAGSMSKKPATGKPRRA